MLAPSLKGVELVDPKDAVPEGYDPAVMWDGLGILEYAVAPHYKSDHPESADVDKYVDYCKENAMPCRALRDGEVIVVNGEVEKLL